MNILMMADYRTPCSGNFIASLLELAEKIREDGGYVHFVFPENRNGGGYSWSAWLEENGFPVTLIHDSVPHENVLGILDNLVREHGIGIIHSHFGMYTKLLTINAKKLGVRVVFHDHMDFSPEGNVSKQWLRTVLFSGLYRMKRIHVISVMELKSKAYLLCGKKYSHYIPNGLSLRRNVPLEVSREQRREELGIEKNEKLCLFLGWDKYRKGLDVAVKAVEAYRRTDPSMQFGVIGVGYPPGSETLNWIREKTGVDPECSWLRFFESYEDMFACHRAADVYLSASRKEAFSYGLLEAISQNTPVVVSDIEGTAWATAYSKAVTYPVEDHLACANAIGRATELGRRESNAAELVNRYGIDGWCRAVMDVYRKVQEE